ncbi:MAG TPA: FHA domain-containing protein [Thermoleophilaceae bacterium]|nr:FHA domain-containing protein [Thermoleophilaceae bacterium]
MSDDPLAVALQFGFLAILYLFLLWVARSARRDLIRGQEPALADPPPEGDEPRPGRLAGGPDLSAGVDPRLEVVAAMGLDPGTVIDVSEGATFGRGGSADIHVEDPFASSVHARIFTRNGFMHVEDMGSTNGTYLNGRQLRKAEQLKPADTIRIGDSEYRYQE